MSAEPRPELFADVAAQFEALEQPMNMQWMIARCVSLEELHAVSRKCALILRGYSALTPAQRLAFVQQGLFEPTAPVRDPAETVLGERLSASDSKSE
jgi:hypothetical protein